MGGMVHVLFKRKKLTPEQESKICMGCQFCCRWIGYQVPLKANVPEYYSFIHEWGIPLAINDDIVHFYVPLPCQHISDKEGCRKYKDRPTICRAFRGGDADSMIIPYCGWYEYVGDEARFKALRSIEWPEPIGPKVPEPQNPSS